MIIYDQNGCQTSFDTTVTQPEMLVNQFIYNPIPCFGDSTFLQALVSGGTQPIQHLWGNNLSSPSIIAYAGEHSVQIQDANNCSIKDSVLLIEPEVLTMDMSNDTTVCSNSWIQVKAWGSGGTAPYSIQWPGFGNQINDSLWFEVFLPCTVNARLTDQNGCQVEDSAIAQLFVITENDFELQVNDDRVCVNDSVVMDYTYIGTMPMLTVNWVNCLECSFPRTAWIKSDSIFTAELISFCLDTIRKSIPVDMIEIPDMRFDLSGGEICPNEAFLLQADSISAGDWNFTWDFGNGIISNSAQNTVGYAEPGIYFVNLTIQHAEGCVYETDGMDSILVHTSPIANFDTDKTEKSFIDPVFDFTNLSQDAVQFDWNFGDGATSNLENPSHEYEWHGNYLVQLIAINSIGCPDTIVKPILITPDHIIWVPNAFTPDGSNFNESFGIKGHGISDEGFLLRIFDRWGEIIFETADLEDNWDGTYMGKISPDGVYTYQVTYRDLNHKSYLKLGHVTLLR
jgi:large repetitive protein